MKIRWLVEGHTQQAVSLERARELLQEAAQENLIIDDETQQLAKIEGLTEKSRVTVFPIVKGG